MIEVGSIVVLADGSLGKVEEIFGLYAKVHLPTDGENYKVEVRYLTEHILEVGDRVQVKIPQWMVVGGFNPVPCFDDHIGTVVKLTDGQEVVVAVKSGEKFLNPLFLRKI